MNRVFKKIVSLALSAAMVATLLPAQPIFADESATLPEKLAYFSFDEDVTTGGNAVATVAGGTATVSTEDKVVGAGALSLSSSGFLKLTKADGSALLAGKENITIDYYSKTANNANKSWSFTASRTDGKNAYPNEKYLSVQDWASTVNIQRWNNNGSRQANELSTATSANWKKITFVIAETYTQLYIDGVKKAETKKGTVEPKLSEILTETGGFCWIGRNYWDGGEFFTGSIDEFTIYDGILTEAQIAEAYAANLADDAKARFAESFIAGSYMGSNTDVTKINSDLHLPASFAGIDITWTSSAEDKITTDGKVLVKDGSEVTLTGTAGDLFTLNYTVTLATTATINFVDEEGATLTSKIVEDLRVGDSYTYEILPNESVLTIGGKSYEYDAENSSLTITVAASNEVTVAYKEAVLEAQEEVVEISTRVEIAPVLPEFVGARFSSGSVIPTAVEWEEVTADKYAAAGTFTVNGKFVGTEVAVTATVTVKEVADYLMAKYSFDEEMSIDEVNPDNEDRYAELLDGAGYVEGLVGTAVELPGDGASLNVGAVKLPEDLLAVDGAVQDDFTLSFFIKNANVEQQSTAVMLHADVVNQAWSQQNSTRNHFAVVNRDSGRNNEDGLWVEYFTKSDSMVTLGGRTHNTPADEWAHVAVVTKASTGEAWLYLNGKEIAYTSTLDVKMSDLPGRLNYLGRTDWPDPDHAAVYDEFALYSTPLTAREVKRIYKDGFGIVDANKDALTGKLAEVEAAVGTLVEADYTEASWALLQEAITKAKAAMADEDVTQEAVDAVLAALADAQAKLEKKKAPVVDTNVKVSAVTIENPFAAKSLSIAKGKKVQLTAVVAPTNATLKDVTWASDKASVATVDASGKVSAKKPGSATITATAKDGSGVKATIKVKVVKGVVKKVALKVKKTLSVKAGKATNIKTKVTATKGANKKLILTSNKPEITKIKGTKVTIARGTKKGTKVAITIMATDGSGKKAKVTLKVK